MSKIKSLGVVVSDSLSLANNSVLIPASVDQLTTASSTSQAQLQSQVARLGPQMTLFLGEVRRLQQIVRTCNEVQAIANAGVLAGLRVAEEVRGTLTTSFVDSDTLIGDEITNEAEDFE